MTPQHRLLTAVVAAVLVAALGAVACGRPQRGGKRVIVLGFDGMDHGVVTELIGQGRMPNFARLAQAGGFSPLRTSIPPQSPVAWSSVISGLNPGGHGIFDFIHRDAATMLPYLSTTRTTPASRTLSIGSWRFPLSGGNIELLRDGPEFWEALESAGIETRIIRMPANFPPSGRARYELGGMGTPDLLGTYGTFSFYTSEPGALAGGTMADGRVFGVSIADQTVTAELIGPDHPFRAPGSKLRIPFSVFADPRSNAAKIVIGDEERVLKAGEWSDWVPVDFDLTWFQSLRGMVRFYLRQVQPSFQLYVSPINIDPVSPAMPISTPATFAADLARATGRFHTQGIAEDTKALSDRVLNRDEFLAQARAVGAEVKRQYWHVLNQFQDGLLFYYFGNLDQISHMMWRPRDPGHPAYDATLDGPYRTVVDDLYSEFDAIVGDTLSRIRDEDTLIVMSDHGFTSWRRSFHLNSWLRDNGYLAVIDPFTDPGMFQNVDWSRTRAYGLGLNGLYLNVRGRERDGIVAPDDRARLASEIRQKLLAEVDPQTGGPIVTKVVARESAYRDSRHFDVAPDLIVLYAKGTRGSNESALGGIPPGVLADNTSEWSGDHCMDPDAVPGILLVNRPLARRAATLEEMAAAILAEFGIMAALASR